MAPSPLTAPDVVARLLADYHGAQERMTLGETVALVLRRHRGLLGLSQREDAERRGCSKSHVARLEAHAGRLRLDDVVAALEGTGYTLAVCADADGHVVRPAEWAPGELLPRSADGRRFPAAAEVERLLGPQSWHYSRTPLGQPFADWTWVRPG